MVGRIMMTRVRMPARMELPQPRTWQKKSMPTRPNRMEGMPVRVSVANSMISTVRRLLAYSLR